MLASGHKTCHPDDRHSKRDSKCGRATAELVQPWPQKPCCRRPQTKKKSKPEVILDRNTRNKKKCVTTVYGLDGFGIKLSDAAKLFAKKYAGGAAVTKTPTEKEQIDVQVRFKLVGFALRWARPGTWHALIVLHGIL